MPDRRLGRRARRGRRSGSSKRSGAGGSRPCWSGRTCFVSRSRCTEEISDAVNARKVGQGKTEVVGRYESSRLCVCVCVNVRRHVGMLGDLDQSGFLLLLQPIDACRHGGRGWTSADRNGLVRPRGRNVGQSGVA